MKNNRIITYCQALQEAVDQEMKSNPNIIVFGVGVPDHKKIFGTTEGLLEKYGSNRVFDTPISEEAMTGFALGAAINGLTPIHIHIRVDFLLLAMNQIVNMISSLRYGSAGKLTAPLVIRAVIGRGWGQGFQHSKSLQSYFAHIPGLKVAMPTTPYDAKGLLIQSLRDQNPIIFLEHRWLYWQEGHVPEKPYTIPFGQANVLKKGTDITIISTSWMNVEAFKAAEILEKSGVSVEIIDPRTIYPLDEETINNSIKKTKRCIIADNDWTYCGFSAELATKIYEKNLNIIKSPIQRIGFAPTPCPTVRILENEFYPNAINIIKAVEKELNLKPIDISNENFYSHENKFKGPF